MILHCTDLILTFSISGTVNGAVKSGVTMTLSGSGSGSTETDSNGNYSFTSLSNGTYTVTPSKPGYTFKPKSETVTISGADVTGVDFKASAVTFSISGTVSGAVQSGVAMTLSGNSSGTATTDASGNYSFSGLSNGTYTVTPSKPGYTFEPSSETVTISGTDVTGIDFTSSAATHSISGQVTGDVKSGVTMTLSGSGSGNKITNFLGNYSFSGLSNGTYTVTPSKSGYTFTPPSTAVEINNANVAGVDFTASAVTTTCSTWDDVIAEYNAYVAGQVTWDKVITCYNQYIAAHP
jgi:cytoskeletal protein CcmA (bactofilin family)